MAVAAAGFCKRLAVGLGVDARVTAVVADVSSCWAAGGGGFMLRLEGGLGGCSFKLDVGDGEMPLCGWKGDC